MNCQALLLFANQHATCECVNGQSKLLGVQSIAGESHLKAGGICAVVIGAVQILIKSFLDRHYS
jgi:hypothetical protein